MQYIMNFILFGCLTHTVCVHIQCVYTYSVCTQSLRNVCNQTPNHQRIVEKV